MARKHTLDEVLVSLKKKTDCKVILSASLYKDAEDNTVYILCDQIWSKKEGKMITHPEKKFDLGNKSWGKIDYLVNHCGFQLRKVDELPKMKFRG